MAKKLKVVPKGKAKPLYPKGWPGNMQATLYLAQKRRKQENVEVPDPEPEEE
jgi:hypothetical protein